MPVRETRFRAVMDANQARLRAISRTWAPRAWEDLYQEIALQLWRSLDRFEGRASVDTWVYRIALNTAIDFTRVHTPLRVFTNQVMSMQSSHAPA